MRTRRQDPKTMNEHSITPKNSGDTALSEMRETLLALPPERALERILDTAEPAPLVHSFPEEDLYLLIQDIGVSDALPLISLASDRQLEFILDMELWDGDRIIPRASEQWLALFHQADPVRLARWLMDRQTEWAEYYLFKNIEIQIRDHDQDPSDFGEGFVTMDNTFFIRPRNVPDEMDAAGSLPRNLAIDILRHMADRDHVRYMQILMEAAALLPAEYEEEAYRLRNVRLAEKGFLPFEEAVGIYQPLSVPEVGNIAGKTGRRLSPEQASHPVPLSPSGAIREGSLFAEALKRVDSPEALDRIRIEFATLCNTIAVADKKKIRGRNALSGLVDKACGYLSIGIERITGDDREASCARSAHLVSTSPLIPIFRVGYGRVLSLGRRARQWRETSWFRGRRLPLTFWGEAWLGVLGGLLLKRPLYYDNYQTGVLYREFAAAGEIEKSRNVLDSIIAIDGLLSVMGLPSRLPEVSATSPITCQNLVLTLWALDVLDLGNDPASLLPADFKRFFGELWEGGREARRIKSSMKTHFLGWLANRAGRTPGDISMRLAPVLDALFDEIEEEYGQVHEKDLDPRYIHLFLIRSNSMP